VFETGRVVEIDHRGSSTLALVALGLQLRIPLRRHR
jgi:hypothetical protein